MNDSFEQILASARQHVTEIYKSRHDPKFVFHNIEHTEDVAEACSLMADYYKLNDEDRFVLMVAAWFHDTGYTAGQAEGHEDVSIQMLNEFALSHSIDDVLLQRISSAIQATKMPQSPLSQVEKILCDADLMHLSTQDFRAKNQLLKQERENLLGSDIQKKEWQKNNIEFLSGHKYFTEYGQQFLEPRKQENLSQIPNRKKKKETKKEEVKKEAFPYLTQNGTKEDVSKEAKNAERGVQTMFRTTSRNHLELSSMADSKSHILISVSSIIISVTLSFLISRLAFYPQYMIPTIILITTCLLSVTFAILATRPSVSKGRFTEEDIRNKKTNLLFFGNFHQMELGDYQWGMNQMIKDKEYLYNTMTMDIYFLGVVLAKKYKFLRIAYTIFMVGLIISVLAFGFAAIRTEAVEPATTTGTIDY
jgi:HD-GYP domain-containing protein (c-di-GMP phosphodiesterase class II)